VIAALVDKSVVAVDLALGAGDSGFRIIETLREYGLEKLAAAGETQQAHAALLAWSVALATEAEAAWETMPSQRWEERFGPQLDNVRGALHWSLEERNDIPAGTLLCARLARLFGRIAPFEGRRWTRLALRTHDADDPRRRAELKLAEATVHVALREKSVVLEAGREALAAFEDLGDETNAAQAAVYLGFTLAVSGDPAAYLNPRRSPRKIWRSRTSAPAKTARRSAISRKRLPDFAISKTPAESSTSRSTSPNSRIASAASTRRSRSHSKPPRRRRPTPIRSAS
jgi:hypothetical protein